MRLVKPIIAIVALGMFLLPAAMAIEQPNNAPPPPDAQMAQPWDCPNQPIGIGPRNGGQRGRAQAMGGRMGMMRPGRGMAGQGPCFGPASDCPQQFGPACQGYGMRSPQAWQRGQGPAARGQTGNFARRGRGMAGLCPDGPGCGRGMAGVNAGRGAGRGMQGNFGPGNRMGRGKGFNQGLAGNQHRGRGAGMQRQGRGQFGPPSPDMLDNVGPRGGGGKFNRQGRKDADWKQGRSGQRDGMPGRGLGQGRGRGAGLGQGQFNRPRQSEPSTQDNIGPQRFRDGRGREADVEDQHEQTLRRIEQLRAELEDLENSLKAE